MTSSAADRAPDADPAFMDIKYVDTIEAYDQWAEVSTPNTWAWARAWVGSRITKC